MRHTLIGVMIASTFCQDVVHCLVICNYCIECQLLMSYVECISERVIEKSLVLEVAMKVCELIQLTVVPKLNIELCRKCSNMTNFCNI